MKKSVIMFSVIVISSLLCSCRDPRLPIIITVRDSLITGQVLEITDRSDKILHIRVVGYTEEIWKKMHNFFENDRLGSTEWSKIPSYGMILMPNETREVGSYQMRGFFFTKGRRAKIYGYPHTIINGRGVPDLEKPYDDIIWKF